MTFNNMELIHDAFDNFDNEDLLKILMHLRGFEDAEKPLYPDCTKFTDLLALMKLYDMKAKYEHCNKSFDVLLI